METVINHAKLSEGDLKPLTQILSFASREDFEEKYKFLELDSPLMNTLHEGQRYYLLYYLEASGIDLEDHLKDLFQLVPSFPSNHSLFLLVHFLLKEIASLSEICFTCILPSTCPLGKR